MAAAAGDYVGPKLAPAGLGFVTLFFGIGQALGPAPGGYLADVHSFSLPLFAGRRDFYPSGPLCLWGLKEQGTLELCPLDPFDELQEQAVPSFDSFSGFFRRPGIITLPGLGPQVAGSHFWSEGARGRFHCRDREADIFGPDR